MSEPQDRPEVSLALVVERGFEAFGPGLRQGAPLIFAAVLFEVALGLLGLAGLGRLVDGALAQGPWGPLVVFALAALLTAALEGAAMLVVGAAAMRGARQMSVGWQDGLRMLALGARALAWLGLRVGAPVGLLALVVRFGAPPEDRALLGVLVALAAGLLFAAVSGWGYLSKAMRWPQVALRGDGPGADPRGRRLLLLGLGLAVGGAWLASHAALGFVVPGPDLMGLSSDELRAVLPKLVRAQVTLHTLGGLIVAGVGTWAGTCFGALDALTAGE